MFQFSIIATTIELTLCLACSILLWSRRKQTGDRSRIVLSAVCFTCVIWSVGKYFEYIGHPDKNIYTEILSPEHCFTGLLCLMLYFFYPVIILRPKWFTWQRVMLFILPWLLLSLPYLMQMPFRSLANAGDVLTYVTEFNVWWRLLTVGIIVGYMVLLQMLPYNWRESSADNLWVRRYVWAIAVMAVLYFGYQLTLWMPFHMAHQVYVGLFFVYYTHFELEVRLLPVSDKKLEVKYEDLPPLQVASSTSANNLWQRILQEVDRKEAWKNPDLTVTMLARIVGSNKTYVHQAFSENSHTTYNDYINRQRVEFIAAELRKKPNQNLEDLFYRAGYRSRTTAGRNFKDIMGVTPSDYAASL